MRILLILSCCYLALLSMNAHAETGFYVQGGLAVHNLGSDCPEYCGNNPLGNVGAGYTFKPTQHPVYVDIYVNHESSIADTEQGYGQNKAGINGRLYFK